MALEDATKAIQAILKSGKEYVCLMQLHGNVEEKKLNKVIQEFTGDIYQLPPVKASVKRSLRCKKIYYIRILQMQERMVLFRVACQAGTYIRKLCSDIGEALGTGAHMRELRRIRAGPFHVDENLTTLIDLKNACIMYESGDESLLRKIVMPVEHIFKLTPKIYVRDTTVDALCHGASLAVPGIVKLDLEINKGDLIGIFSLKGEIISLAKATMSSDEILKYEKGIAAQIKRVILPSGSYPSKWKTQIRM